ncbi:tetratricopeptide repeat protein, partial [Candidatus Marinimicrobia bacterium MT.SAG.4]
MKKFVIIISVLLFYSCAYFNTYYNAKKYYKEARKASDKNTTKRISKNELKNYELTVEKCKSVIRKFPDSRYVDDSLLLMAKSYYYMGDYENSKISLEELLRRYPESGLKFEALLWTGRAAWNLGQYSIAEEGIAKVLNETEDKKLLSSGYEMLAEIYRDKNEPEKELEYLEKILENSKNDQQKAETIYRIGFIQKESGLFEESIQSFRKVETYLPSPELLEAAKLEYTRALKYTGRTDEALDVLQAMFDSPRYKKIRGIIEIELADISYREGDIDGAIERYGSIGMKYPKNRSSGIAWNKLGDIHMYQHSITGAVINYHYAMEYYKRAVKTPAKGVYKGPARRNKLILEGFLDSFNKIEENQIKLLLYSGEKEKSVRMEHEHNLFLSEVLDGILPAKVVKKKVVPKSIQTPDDYQDPPPGEKDPSDNAADSSPSDSTNPAPVDSIPKIFGSFADTFSDQNLINNSNPDEPRRESEEPVLKTPKKYVKSPRELIQEIIQHKYLIAEYYFLDLGQPDSAEVIFENFLSEYKESEFAPKAALSLGLLYETIYHDSSEADSFYNIVVKNYPNSPSLVEANRRLNKSKGSNTLIENPANELYEKAYYEGFINKNRKAAYSLTFKIQTEYPSSDIAARAAFLKASIVDQANQSPAS